MRDLAYKTIQVRERLTKETGKEPGIEEIAKELSIDSAHYDLIKLKDEDGVEKFGV